MLYLFRRRVYRPDPTPSSAIFAVEINFRIAPSKRGSSKIPNQLYGVSEAARCEIDKRNAGIQIQLAILSRSTPCSTNVSINFKIVVICAVADNKYSSMSARRKSLNKSAINASTLYFYCVYASRHFVPVFFNSF